MINLTYIFLLFANYAVNTKKKMENVKYAYILKLKVIIEELILDDDSKGRVNKCHIVE